MEFSDSALTVTQTLTMNTTIKTIPLDANVNANTNPNCEQASWLPVGKRKQKQTWKKRKRQQNICAIMKVTSIPILKFRKKWHHVQIPFVLNQRIWSITLFVRQHNISEVCTPFTSWFVWFFSLLQTTLTLLFCRVPTALEQWTFAHCVDTILKLMQTCALITIPIQILRERDICVLGVVEGNSLCIMLWHRN